jgi:hypothetical protein
MPCAALTLRTNNQANVNASTLAQSANPRQSILDVSGEIPQAAITRLLTACRSGIFDNVQQQVGWHVVSRVFRETHSRPRNRNTTCQFCVNWSGVD